MEALTPFYEVNEALVAMGAEKLNLCMQCGDCVLANTAGICPVTSCHKGLLNGPCGGTNNGKCEIDSSIDCAWTLIYNRLEKTGRLDYMRKIQPPKDYSVMTKPRKYTHEAFRAAQESDE